MKFTIETPHASRGIRVVQGPIPDLDLVQIEGSNGIGKTLALHLLELCSGRQPYAFDDRTDSWRTLCRYLGPAKVSVSNLEGPEGSSDHELCFEFDLEAFAEEMPSQVSDEMFTSIRLDGKTIDLATARNWLTVDRIAGDETLASTIRSFVTGDTVVIKKAARVATYEANRADEFLGKELASFDPAHPKKYVEVFETVGRLESVQRNKKSELRELRERQTLLEQALSSRNALRELDDHAEDLDTRIDELISQLREATKARESTLKSLEVAQAQLAKSQQNSEELEELRSLTEKRVKSFEKASKEAAKLGDEIDVPADLGAVGTAMEELQTARDVVIAKRQDRASLISLREVLDSLDEDLRSAVEKGVGDRVIAKIESHRLELTSGDLLNHVRTRRAAIESEDPDLKLLDEEVAGLNEREERLEALKKAVETRKRRNELVTEAQRRLENLAESSDDAQRKVAELASEVSQAQAKEVELGSNLGIVQRQRRTLAGGRTADDIKEELAQLCSDLGVDPADLTSETETLTAQLEVLVGELNGTDTELQSKKEEQTILESGLRDATQRISAGDEFADLREAIGDRIPKPTEDPIDQASQWEAIHLARERVVQRIQEAANLLNETRSGMEELISSIDQKQTTKAELDSIRKHYEDSIKQLLDEAEIRKALFENGTLEKVDLSAREISWKSPQGEQMVRPFEAFSSGERAFAYVRARLSRVAQEETNNHLVAIDEFGAFLSGDRLIRLQQMINDQLAEGQIDQAVVVLPLTRPHDENEPDPRIEPFDPGSLLT